MNRIFKYWRILISTFNLQGKLLSNVSEGLWHSEWPGFRLQAINLQSSYGHSASGSWTHDIGKKWAFWPVIMVSAKPGDIIIRIMPNLVIHLGNAAHWTLWTGSAEPFTRSFSSWPTRAGSTSWTSLSNAFGWSDICPLHVGSKITVRSLIIEHSIKKF